jgi:hypothetical protein
MIARPERFHDLLMTLTGLAAKATCIALCALAWVALPAAAQSLATVTILEGEAFILRGALRLSAAEGVTVLRGDILHTGERAFMRLESADGTIADLGATSRLMVAPPDRRARSGIGDAFLLSGWLKLTAAPKGRPPAVWMSSVELQDVTGTMVVRVLGDEVGLFVERGDARAALRPAAPPALALKTGEYFLRKSAQRPVVSPRPASDFLAALPPAFRDTLPSRLAKFAGTKVEPKRAAAFTYAEVENWLTTDVAVRRHLLPRWRGRLADPAFRAALVANLRAHPEWDPVLFPEKYKPKDSDSSSGKDEKKIAY